MPTPKEGQIVHVEFHSNDPQRTRQFFEDVFGYEFQDVPAMDYTLWKAAGGPAGGLMKTMENMPPQVLNYLLADDIDEMVGRLSAAGGTILRPKMEIQGQGWWALFQEPGGAVMAVYQTLPRPPAARRSTSRRSSSRSRASSTRKTTKARRKK